MVKDIVNNYLNQVEAMKALAREEDIFPPSLDLIVYLGVKSSKEIPIHDLLNEIISDSDSFEYETLVRTAVVMLKGGEYIRELNCTLPENKGKSYFKLTRKGKALYKKSAQALESALKA